MLVLAVSGCGSGVGSTSLNPATMASLRIVDGNGSMSSINVVVDGSPLVNHVTFLDDTGYISVPSGAHQVMLQGWSNPPNLTSQLTLPANAKSTMLFTGWGPFSSGFEVTTDDTTPPAAGNFKLRIVDGAVFGGLDVFVLPAGTPPGGTPTISPMTISENSPSQYFSFPAGPLPHRVYEFSDSQRRVRQRADHLCRRSEPHAFPDPNCPGNSCASNSYTSALLADLN
jgi:Domain of unknown function (DUF4397)